MRFTKVFIGLVAVAMVAMIGWTVYFDIKHPCIQYEIQICTRSVCTWRMNPIAPDWHPDNPCLSWADEEFPCRVCTARKP